MRKNTSPPPPQTANGVADARFTLFGAQGISAMNAMHKIIALFVATAMLVTLGVAVSFRAFHQMEEAAEAHRHTSIVQNSANDFLSELKDAETGQRGYLLTGDETFLQPYLAARKNIGSHLNALHQMTLIPQARKHLDAVAPLLDARMARLLQGIELRRNQDIAAAQAMVINGRGRDLMDAIRTEMLGFSKAAQDAMAQHDAELQSKTRFLFDTLVVFTLVILLSAFAFAWLIYRESKQRLKHLVYLETQHLLEAKEATNQQLLGSQEALRKSEEYFRLALENSSIVIFSHDKELRYTWIYNPTLGLTAQQMLGKTDAEVMTLEDAAHLAEIKHRVMETGNATREEVRITINDNPSFYDLFVEPQRDGTGSIIGVTCVAIDITERKRAEVALQESELRWKFAIEGSGDGLWDWNVAGSTVFFSKRWKEMLGFAEDEIGNVLDEWEKRVHPDGKAEAFAAIQAHFDGKMPSYINEHRVLCKDGSYKWILDRGIVVSRSENGKPLRMIGTHADISVRKKNEQLLLDAMQQLQEKEHSRTRFLSAASHDLRQPIAAATLFVETLKLTTPTPDQGELIELLDQSMGVFSGMLERLLDISKFDAGLVEPKIKPIPMTKLFDWLNRTFAQQAIDRQLRFRLFLPQSKALVVRTDIVLLQSVLMNLISNALKFTARGGILVSARLHGDQVLLQVWDTGIGVAEADISHVFDEFYQVGNPQRNRKGGLGLGLSICQRTMHLLGSEVTCRSHPGRGSVFGFSLPLDAAHLGVKPTIAPAPTDEILFSGKRVVVVEDDELVAAGLLGLLRASGAEVRHFINAEEALRHDDFASADYFITDYALGGALTGFQFLEKVQQQRQTPISAVIITGETSAQFNDSVADSPWPVLHKPVSLAGLISGLRH